MKSRCFHRTERCLCAQIPLCISFLSCVLCGAMLSVYCTFPGRLWNPLTALIWNANTHTHTIRIATNTAESGMKRKKKSIRGLFVQPLWACRISWPFSLLSGTKWNLWRVHCSDSVLEHHTEKQASKKKQTKKKPFLNSLTSLAAPNGSKVELSHGLRAHTASE